MGKIDFKDELFEYSEEDAHSIVNRFKENILSNKEVLEKANLVDIEVTKKQIVLDSVMEIIDSYENKKLQKLEKFFIAVYKGDPYITISLFMQALLTRSRVVLCQDEFMISINEILFTIFENTLKEFKINNLIKRCKYDKEKICKLRDALNAEVVCIGDTTMYQILEEGKFYPYYNIMMYCDSELLEPVKEAIWIYANENNYELEIVYDDNIENTINYMNMVETTNIVVVLSENEDTLSEFKEGIKKKLFINKNPFIKSYGKIYEYIK